MSQFRQDNITKQWVLIAPKRSLRPRELEIDGKSAVEGPEIDKSCVFCPGNENLNPDVIMALPSERSWNVRVIPNKYEALSHKTPRPLDRELASFYSTRPGAGDHEVIILRKHNRSFAELSQSEIETVLKVWLARIADLYDHSEVRYVHLMQNHGKLSGASIAHPHFQIYAVPFVPPQLADEMSGAAAYFRAHEKCVYCEMVRLEKEDGSRLVYENNDFIAFCSFAARVPFEIKIVPKNHSASITSTSVRQSKNLAAAIKDVLSKIFIKLGNPDYNLYVHTIPLCAPTNTFCDPVSYHWHIEILPRTSVFGGFELGTEIFINPVAPEEAASYLLSDSQNKKLSNTK